MNILGRVLLEISANRSFINNTDKYFCFWSYPT